MSLNSKRSFIYLLSKKSVSRYNPISWGGKDTEYSGALRVTTWASEARCCFLFTARVKAPEEQRECVRESESVCVRGRECVCVCVCVRDRENV